MKETIGGGIVKLKNILSWLILGLAIAVNSVSPSIAQNSQLIKFSTMDPETGSFTSCFTQPFLEDLVQASGGRIEIETYMGGTGFANPLRQYEQAARGVIDITHGVLSYNPGQFAMTEIATMPLLFDDAVAASRAINKLAPQYLADEFKDIHLMAILVTPPLYVHQRDAITDLDGLKGKRVRSTGVGAKAFLEAFGAIPVQLPSPAVYENLQTGVIDGALQDSLALHEFRISEVAGHHLEVNTTVALLFLGMNKRTLARLPADLQEIITTEFSGPEVGARASQCWTDLGAELVTELKAEGQIFTSLSEEDVARAKAVSIEIAEDYINALQDRGKPARAFYDALVAELAAQSNQ